MKLILFDIDGTLIDSVKTDDECFKMTFKNLYHIDVSKADWNDFNHITDLGLTIEIFNKWLHRTPSKKEITDFKTEFQKLLRLRTKEFTEIEGALKFINYLSKHPDYKIVFATGGWKETALLKCGPIGLDLNQYILKSSNNHFNREIITELAIAEALEQNNHNPFSSITYFGDGLWDLKTTSKLGINFIGVDFKNTNKLFEAGCAKVINDYRDLDDILDLID